jgi:hypothetical protein
MTAEPPPHTHTHTTSPRVFASFHKRISPASKVADHATSARAFFRVCCDGDDGKSTVANPMSGYDQYKGARTSWGINALGSVVAEVESDDGHIGVGVTIGGEPAAYIIENHLRCVGVGA